MPYDEHLTARMRAAIGPLPEMEEKKMFGGVGFLVNGNMACGVHKDGMIGRVGPEKYDEALSRPHTRVFDMTGRPMTGWIVVEPAGVASQTDLRRWIDQGVKFTVTLPPK